MATYTETGQETKQPDIEMEQPLTDSPVLDAGIAMKEPTAFVKGAEKLLEFRNMVNMAAEKGGADFSEYTLMDIGNQVLEGYQSDESSRDEWLERYEKSIQAAMQEQTTKNYPFNNASNVKYPLVSSACQQFAARSYGAIIKGTDVVKGKVLIDDPNNELQEVANRIGLHMSNQLLEEMSGWLDGLDMTLTQLPNVGAVFKKTYFSKIKRMNVSEYISAKDLVIKYKAKSMEDAPRITHPQTYTHNEIVSFIKSGQWREDAETIFPGTDDSIEDSYDYLEQHCWYDFDEDGYKEPYIVTIEKNRGKVVKIVARYDMSGVETNDNDEIIRIKAINYFTRYIFLQSPDEGIYGMGFGTLLGPMNAAIDTILNQMIDAGTLHNTGGGFISSRVKLGKKRESTMPFRPNELKTVDFSGDIRENIFMLPTKEPSSVLFQLLGVLLDAGKELSSVTNLMSGESRGANESPNTVLALIEQGTMVFTAIYKRIYRSLKEEFKKIYRLNSIYLTSEYITGPQTATQEDYLNARVAIVPIADPTDATNMQRIAKAQALMSLKGQGLNDEEITRRYLVALDIEDIEGLFPEGEPPPNPALVMEQERLQMEKIALNLQTDTNRLARDKFHFEQAKEKTNMTKTMSEAVLNLAKAEAQEEGTQMAEYKQYLDSLIADMETMNVNQQRGVGEPPDRQNTAMEKGRNLEGNPGGQGPLL